MGVFPPVRTAPAIRLSEDERAQLERWARGRLTPQRLVVRSRIVLAAADGRTNRRIARDVGVREDTVGVWRHRFHANRLEGIAKDAPRPGRKPQIPQDVIDRILRLTLHEKPRGATHWSTRSMAKRVGVSNATVSRVWRSHRLQPHRTRTFKLSRDPRFEEKVRDIVGLYLNPPEKAVVFCVDEKTQIQALDRTQAILPLRPGLPEGRTHDYRRNGKIDLFAALNVLDGTVVHEFHHRHRHREFLVFLRTIDERVPGELDIHLILDNLSAHKHEKVNRWLQRRPRFHLHWTPTGSSWMNLVERWLDELTDKAIRRGTFPSVGALKKAIVEFLETYHESPRPFVWTATADEIIRKVAKIRHLLVTGH